MRAPPQLDMTADGRFVGRFVRPGRRFGRGLGILADRWQHGRDIWPRLGLGRVLFVLAGVGLAFAALLALLLLLLPVVFCAGFFAALAFRLRSWRRGKMRRPLFRGERDILGF